MKKSEERFYELRRATIASGARAEIANQVFGPILEAHRERVIAEMKHAYRTAPENHQAITAKVAVLEEIDGLLAAVNQAINEGRRAHKEITTHGTERTSNEHRTINS